MSIRTAAEDFANSYAAAMAIGPQSLDNTTKCASALASHYLENFTSFTFGHIRTLPTGEDAVNGIDKHLQNFVKHGLGLDVRLKKSRVEVVSLSSALCWITWELYPLDKSIEGWDWENVYSYRVRQDGKAGWESVISDNEIAGLTQRVPKFFEGYFG
ncbi:MAG: hypothetical protein M1820_006393 [Bogoriella megaspora]|nr:MAG: hypothetical protein M1820_006393 [Bogoriella megaspora]